MYTFTYNFLLGRRLILVNTGNQKIICQYLVQGIWYFLLFNDNVIFGFEI